MYALEQSRPARDFDQDFCLKLYDTYRNRVQHEDGLLSQRVSFLLTSQAFLLTPYVLSYTADRSKIADPKALDNLQRIIPIIGLISCLVALAGASAAAYAIALARSNYDSVPSDLKLKIPMPGIHSNRLIHTAGLAPAFGFITILFLVWLSFILRVDTFKDLVASISKNLTIIIGSVVLASICLYVGRIWGRKGSKRTPNASP